MDVNYDADLCKERHENIKAILDDHENRLNGHSKRLDDLEKDNRENRTDIRNLCKDIQNLISTIKWGLGIFVTVSIFVVGTLLKK